MAEVHWANSGTAGCDPTIYLASPYSHPDEFVRAQRFESACHVAADLVRAGHIVYSLVAHGHPIAQHGLPTNWSFWERCNRSFIEKSNELVVLTLDGWESSEGVQSEIRIAVELGKPVRYLDRTPTLARVAKEEGEHG